MSFELRGVNFVNSVFNTAGARNFFGASEIGGDWRQHKPLNAIPGYDWEGATFVSKTTTLEPRQGNMPLRSDLQSEKFLPDCIYVDWRQGIVLNDVSLSGPGANFLLTRNIWQEMKRPLLISFMAIGENAEGRLSETIKFCGLIKKRWYNNTRFGLEFNASCPNAGHDPQSLIAEATKKLQAARQILPEVPFLWKINALTSPWQAKEVIDAGCCDAISVSNTIPWLQNATWDNNPAVQINWTTLFGRDTISPLKRRGFGNGGLSGWPLLDLVVKWVATARKIGITLPIKAEGGIQKKDDIRRLADAGANAIGLGCVSFLRPWRLKSLIDYGNSVMSGGNNQTRAVANCNFSKALCQN